VPAAVKATSPAAAHHAPKHPSVSPDEAMRRLIEGNARFVHDIDHVTTRDIGRRGELASGQAPFAIVLSCADSRVPPELVFDQELGDLFVLRVAGNTADDAILGSIEYAVDHLGTKLILVMGHTACGAVKAAVDTAASGKGADSLPGHLPAVVAPIMPAVAETRKDAGDPVRLAVMRHVQRTVASLRTSGPSISGGVEAGGLRVVGAIYDLATGEVDFLPELSTTPMKPAVEAASASEPHAPADGH
jgi:carbonic anhydrase